MADLSDFEWVDEPPQTETHPKGKHHAIAAALRARPGQWALVQRGVSPGTASGLRGGKAYQPNTDFEITTRRAGDNLVKRDIYIRFVGDAL